MTFLNIIYNISNGDDEKKDSGKNSNDITF